MGNLKGKAYRKEVYLHKKKHPVRWWIVRQLRWLISLINANDGKNEA